jgi:hypothetical protein
LRLFFGFWLFDGGVASYPTDLARQQNRQSSLMEAERSETPRVIGRQSAHLVSSGPIPARLRGELNWRDARIAMLSIAGRHAYPTERAKTAKTLRGYKTFGVDD